jgi:hypothetical protein
MESCVLAISDSYRWMFHNTVHNGSGAQPTSCPMGTGGTFLGRIKLQGHEADPLTRN